MNGMSVCAGLTILVFLSSSMGSITGSELLFVADLVRLVRRPYQPARGLCLPVAHAEQRRERLPMALADKPDAVDFLIGDPGQQFDERYARIMRIVVRPQRRVARDQVARVENQLLEVDRIEVGHREGHATSPTPTWILSPFSAAQMSAGVGRSIEIDALNGIDVHRRDAVDAGNGGHDAMDVAWP